MVFCVISGFWSNFVILYKIVAISFYLKAETTIFSQHYVFKHRPQLAPILSFSVFLLHLHFFACFFLNFFPLHRPCCRFIYICIVCLLFLIITCFYILFFFTYFSLVSFRFSTFLFLSNSSVSLSFLLPLILNFSF